MRELRMAGWIALVALVTGCGTSSPEAREPGLSADAGGAAPPSSASSPGASASSAPAPTTSAAASAEAKPDTRVHDACVKLCERVASACPKGRGEACLAQCGAYESQAKGCVAETEAALSCQAKSSDSFCDNVASSQCTQAFIRMQRCQRGEAMETATASKAGLPADWQKVTDDAWKLSFAMPKGAALDDKAKTRTWRVAAGGASYEVVELARPKSLEGSALVKLVIAHVGIGCQKEMKLTGRVDTDTMTFTRFEARCTNGDAVRGKLRVDATRVVSAMVRGAVPDEHREGFLESIQ